MVLDVVKLTWTVEPVGVVGVEDGFDLVFALEGFGDGGLDAFAGAVGNFAVEDLGGKGAAGAAEIAAVQPLTHDALELAEQMELGLGAGVAVFGEKEMLRQVEGDGGRAQSAQVLKGERVAFADDALDDDHGRPDKVGREAKLRVFGELGGEAGFRQLDAVALDAGEADFEGIAVGADGTDADGGTRRLGRSDDGLGGEIERDAENVGIFDGEEAARGRGRRTGGGGRDQRPARKGVGCRRRGRPGCG